MGLLRGGWWCRRLLQSGRNPGGAPVAALDFRLAFAVSAVVLCALMA